MKLDRRSFLYAAAAATAAGALDREALARLAERLADEPRPRVVWLQGAGCDGCAVSFLNSVAEATADQVLTAVADVRFQSNLMAAAGDLAVTVAQDAVADPGYVLVVEGAVPVAADGRYCVLWPGMTMLDAVTQFAVGASAIVAIGACASFGGMSGGDPDPTQARGVGEVLGADPRLVNLPGCPCHPDWLVGTLGWLIANGALPPLDEHRRPLMYYGRRIHDTCFKRREYCGVGVFAPELGADGCMELLGCKGKHSHADCAIRQWNAPSAGRSGVSWCVGSRSPCLGCVEPGFPDAMSPFYEYLPAPGEE